MFTVIPPNDPTFFRESANVPCSYDYFFWETSSTCRVSLFLEHFSIDAVLQRYNRRGQSLNQFCQKKSLYSSVTGLKSCDRINN